MLYNLINKSYVVHGIDIIKLKENYYVAKSKISKELCNRTMDNYYDFYESRFSFHFMEPWILKVHKNVSSS